MWLFLILTLMTTAITMVCYLPDGNRSLIAELKRQFRLRFIRHSGEQAMQSVTRELYLRAVSAGHDPDLVEEIIQEDWDIIRDRLGWSIADDILGEPSPLERYG